MLERAEGRERVYERLWAPRDYLRQYYSSSDVPGDERANFAFAAKKFRACGRRFRTALEVGCGPTLHHALAIVPYVEEIHLADYLPSNLEEVRRFLSARPDAHDWDVYFRGALAAEGESAPSELAARKALLRRRVTRLKAVDVRQPQPLGEETVYDVVASYYCLEAAVAERDEWGRCLANVSGLVAPGGVLLLGAVRRCHAYHVFDRAFPTAFVDETDFAAELPKLGFVPEGIEIVAVPVAEWDGQGFNSVCCVWAEKPR